MGNDRVSGGDGDDDGMADLAADIEQDDMAIRAADLAAAASKAPSASGSPSMSIRSHCSAWPTYWIATS